jgi:tetratricopeptide (TPR) repeat protein
MKKWISVALATFCTVSFVEATTLKDTHKQLLICEEEVKDSQQCIKAADMLLEVSKKATKSSLLRCELFGVSEETCKSSPAIYQKTDKEFFNHFISEAYYNAGLRYNRNMEYEKGVAMYKKAIEYNPNAGYAYNNLGISYYHGQGVVMDKIKAYEHYSIAKKHGFQEAQKNLDKLCSESPWACK